MVFAPSLISGMVRRRLASTSGSGASPWRDRAADAGSNAPFVVRFKTPMDGDTVIEDAVRGTVHMPNKDLEDLILLRTDGTPTYNVAVTVDDHDMGITHVIRGEEHLGNAARQALMYRAMDWTVPVFAHLPLILGADGSKMSKRHGARRRPGADSGR